MRRALIIAVLATACGSKAPTTPTVPPGLAAIPPRLAYLCVTPGCEETQTAEINVRGSRRVAIKRILLAGGGSSDFSFMPSEPPPFIVGGGSSFTVDVKYAPKGAPAPGEARLLVTYTDASPDESPDRLPPGEIAIPLVRRIVGEPLLTVSPKNLQFGVVSVGDAGTKSVRVQNDGFGNLVLEIASVDAGGSDFSAQLPAQPSMGPDAGFDLPITFRPTGEQYVKATITVNATATEVPPAYVTVEGTSLSTPRLALEQPGDVDFGLVAKGKTRLIDRQLVNQGGADLVIGSITITDALNDVKLNAPLVGLDGGVLTLKPLQRVPLQLLIDGVTPGDVDATLIFSSNDPLGALIPWHVRGIVTDPKVQLSPVAITFGNTLPDGGTSAVPSGWVMNRTLEVMNTGYGPLTVKNVTLVAGGSAQFMLTLPALPATLDRNARMGINVQFTAPLLVAPFMADVSVETDDVQNPFVYSRLTANVAACGPMTCPIVNGTPACNSGSCQVGSCNAGFYDTDLQASTGCECREIGTDPGQFCMSSYYAGNLTDESSSATQFTGLIATQADEDLVVFHGEDENGFFSDAYDVKIRLDSADPGIRMCVYHHKGGHDGNCYFSDETCPGNRFYRDDGSLGPDDGADYVIKVFRDPQSVPACIPYNLFMSNGR